MSQGMPPTVLQSMVGLVVVLIPSSGALSEPIRPSNNFGSSSNSDNVYTRQPSSYYSYKLRGEIHDITVL